MKRLAISAVVTAMLAGTAVAQDLAPAVVFDMGGKFDKSFNEGIFNGVERFRTETGVDYREFQVTQEAQREQALRNFARRGQDPIIAVGFAQAPALEAVATEFPDTRFAIIDAVVDLPNVQSIVFKEQEGSYIVGVLAGLKSKTGKVGFVGGMDIPLISRFACGYVQGVKSVNPDAEVFVNMTGTTPAAWNNPVRGGELTRSQIDRGADIVYHAAGGTGIGVLQAAADAGILGIGVDSNQNFLHPGSVLTSMLKRVDVAAFNVFKSSLDGTFQPGIRDLGLAENGVGFALDENNADLITPEMKAAADQAIADIIAGRVEVHDFMSDNSCPFF